MVRETSLANLRPPVQKGEVRNPRGRVAAGLNYREWCNAMSNWTRGRVEAVLQDPESKMSKIWAAVDCIIAAEPGGGDSRDRICDRTEGKPLQRNEHAVNLLPSAVNVRVPGMNPTDGRN